MILLFVQCVVLRYWLLYVRVRDAFHLATDVLVVSAVEGEEVPVPVTTRDRPISG